MDGDLADLDDLGAFTLEDAHDNLQDVRDELLQEIDELMHRMVNNEFGTAMQCVGQDQIKDQHHKLMLGLLENLCHQDPKVLPIAETIDLHKTIIHNLTEVVDDMQKVMESIEIDSEKTRKNIAYLINKKVGLEKMKNACQGAIENVGTHETYRKEIAVTKALFNEVKADLYTCVDTIFPDNVGFKDLLADLTQAYTRGGEDVYIDVNPNNLEFVKFLIETDIAVYHRNDKTKIKMTDLL